METLIDFIMSELEAARDTDAYPEGYGNDTWVEAFDSQVVSEQDPDDDAMWRFTFYTNNPMMVGLLNHYDELFGVDMTLNCSHSFGHDPNPTIRCESITIRHTL